MEMIQRISDIYRLMTHASMRAGREPDAARLIAVSKTVGSKAVYEAYDDGLRDFGENRLQEAQKKAGELDGLNITWHMVGHLQSNKAKAAVELFDLIQSVDSAKLLRLIDRHAAEMGKVQRVLLQVKLAEEESKAGADEAGLQEMMDEVASMEHVRVEGLMTVPPFYDDPERARPFFRRLRELAGRFGLKELSMGMTGDFEVAVEEGATMVRIGTAIFGERDYA
jgi:pyridoxal phosphate enzyme (YggS family)